MILCLDETIGTETPPLRARWARQGEQATVLILGFRGKRALYGVLNVQTGTALVQHARHWNQATFQEVLRAIRRTWRGWRIVLFLDRGSPHQAGASRGLAKALGIPLRWLPVACPELNPVDPLWRHVKQEVFANEPLPNLDMSVERACAYIMTLSPRERLRKAGVLSNRFWLRKMLQRNGK